ncbi:glutathione peroxidase [Alienimonas sp. DA493]|uniref:glutathione peroxidase n=1 Tax=Alienimonas sp. DA493 TaxID=3373605 RepID=UPI0037548004
MDHKVQSLDGAEVDLAQYRGKVVLIVNVASQCGFTKQYKPLEEIYEKYRDRGFVILGFPCNQFGGQEPGSPAEIAAFCEKNYGVEFPLMGKIEVKGPNASPLYEELTAEGTTDDPGPVKWNFEKFLVGRDGRVIERFRSQASPDSKAVVSAIEKALKAEAPADAADPAAAE